MREVELKVVAPLKEVIIGLSAPEGGCIWPESLNRPQLLREAVYGLNPC